MAAKSSHNGTLRPLLRGLPVIVVFVTVAVLVARWYLRHTVPMYESTAKIRLADPHTGESSANLYKDFDVFASSNQIGTEVEMVKARVLVAKTLDSIEMQTLVYRVGKMIKTELYHDNPLLPHIAITDEKLYGKPLTIDVLSVSSYRVALPGSTRTFEARFGTPLTVPGAAIRIDRNDSLLREKADLQLTGKYLAIVYSREQAIDKIIAKLDITSVDKDVPILRLIYRSPVPEKAATYVNILANTYINDYVDAKYRAANITVNFLDRQLADVSKQLAASENTIERFRNDRKIINIRQETETDLRKIAQLKIQLANLQMSLAAIDSLDHYIQDGKNRFLDLAPNFEAFTDLLSTEMIKKLKQLQSDREDLLLRYTEKEDKVQVIDQKIKDISSYLQESIRNTRNNYEIKYRQISAAIDSAQQVFTGLPTREKDMAILERNFDLNEKIYNYLHQKRTEAQIARAATISFHRIVATGAIPDDPVSPNKVVIVAVSAILALLASIALIFTVHKAKAKVNSAAFIEKTSSTPVAAEINVYRKTPERIQHFTNLAIELELKKVLPPSAVVALSSFDDREGKTFVAAHLAIGLAALSKKILLIDVAGNTATKLRWPSVFPLINRKGEALSAEGPSGICPTPIQNLYYLPIDTVDAVKPVLAEQWRKRLTVLRESYDLILIRNQSIRHSANALVYMATAEVNLFLVDARRTPARQIMEADLVKEKFHIPAMHFLLNRSQYNPSLLIEARSLLKQWRHLIKSHRRE